MTSLIQFSFAYVFISLQSMAFNCQYLNLCHGWKCEVLNILKDHMVNAHNWSVDEYPLLFPSEVNSEFWRHVVFVKAVPGSLGPGETFEGFQEFVKADFLADSQGPSFSFPPYIWTDTQRDFCRSLFSASVDECKLYLQQNGCPHDSDLWSLMAPLPEGPPPNPEIGIVGPRKRLRKAKSPTAIPGVEVLPCGSIVYSGSTEFPDESMFPEEKLIVRAALEGCPGQGCSLAILSPRMLENPDLAVIFNDLVAFKTVVSPVILFQLIISLQAQFPGKTWGANRRSALNIFANARKAKLN